MKPSASELMNIIQLRVLAGCRVTLKILWRQRNLQRSERLAANLTSCCEHEHDHEHEEENEQNERLP